MATFGEITRTLLHEKENYGALYHCVHALHDFYASVTGISAEQTTDNNIELPTGKAISPGQAANCLLDLQRTAVFLRGIHKAILQLQKDFPDQPISYSNLTSLPRWAETLATYSGTVIPQLLITNFSSSYTVTSVIRCNSSFEPTDEGIWMTTGL